MEDDAEQWRQPDLAQFPDPQLDDGSHLINTIPALKTRQETLADELHDFENVFEGTPLQLIFRHGTHC